MEHIKDKKTVFVYEINAYEKILNGTLKSFSPYFFNVRYRKKRISSLIKYLIEDLLNIEPKAAIKIINKKLLVKYKLISILKYIDRPVELEKDDFSYIVYYAYPELGEFSQKELTIEYYKKILKGEKRCFPKNYFLDGVLGEERAKYCFTYLCEEVLKLKKVDDIQDVITVDILKEYKLKILLTTLYFSVFDLISNVYSEETLYKF